MLCLADTSAQELKFEWSQTWLKFCKDSLSKWALKKLSVIFRTFMSEQRFTNMLEWNITKPETPFWRGRICTINLLVLTSSDHLLLILKRYTSLFSLISFLNEEVNCTKPFLLARVPWTKVFQKSLQFEGIIKHHSKLECLTLSDTFTLV